MEKLSPMMEHYLQTKEENPDSIVFYRLGDFYEMFYEDAKIASKELELTLTGKQCGLSERAPMCGVPFHAADTYINRLVAKGYKVAICEQVEDPKTAKGIVKREVIRTVTPGTNIDNTALDETVHNYIACINYYEGRFGLANADVSTGDFLSTQVDTFLALCDEIAKFEPSELLISGKIEDKNIKQLKMLLPDCCFQNLDASYFESNNCKRVLCEHFNVKQISLLDLGDFEVCELTCGALLRYVKETQKSELNHITKIVSYVNGNFMMIDANSRRNLELVETMRQKEKRGSLLWVLDKTKTAMGARMLRSYIEQPLVNSKMINDRYDAIESLNNSVVTREELREYLNAIYDLQRITTRIIYRTANPRDLIAFRNSISVLPGIKAVLSEFSCDLLVEICNEIDTLSDLYELINESISEDCPISTHEGGILKDGYLVEVDQLRNAKTEGKNWLAELEEKEKAATGIKNLKIKYNKVFGYYLEVTNSFKDLVPDYFIRKQTLANAERFYTPELKELENTILGAEDKLVGLEFEIYSQIIESLSSQVERILNTSNAIAKLDAMQSLAVVAEKNHYCRPVLNDNGTINIEKGRHPVVELMIDNGQFIDNDTFLDSNDHRISIITGPNMAGKSTYMRQTALICLMAQVGSFVPADAANVCVLDRIFTRVGASDDLASGQSTFMVEMNEVANILRNATKNSLLILDEIGRGTSTFDGLAIAWAVVEHIADVDILGAKTLFATHYHELTELENLLKGVNNYRIAVKENGDDIVFLRKIVPGGADRSYGIQVARLAGVPDEVLDRAKDIVEQLLENDLTTTVSNIKPSEAKTNSRKDKDVAASKENYEYHQFSLFDNNLSDIETEIKELDLSNMTPMEALLKLNELQSKVNKNA